MSKRDKDIEKAEFDFEIEYPLGVKHDSVIVKESFVAGAKWADRTMIENLKKFLKNNNSFFHLDADKFIEDFKQFNID